MIITKTVRIKSHNNLKKYYILLGYDMSNEFVNINVCDLTKGSHHIINVKCDVCGIEKNIIYKEYNNSISNGGYYTCCEKCSVQKQKDTFLKKYGVEYATQNEKIKEKTKQTCLEKYSVEYISQVQEIKDKKKETCLEKYSVEYISQVQEIKDKKKETMIKKYGVEFYVLSNDFLLKSQETSIKNYGTLSPIQSEKHKLERINKRKENGTYIDKTEYSKYRNTVDTLTKRVKFRLYEKWNGLDSYDGEYIKDNFELYYTNGSYPSTDHIYPVIEGFRNNIEPEKISNINNLCITKRKNNSKKGNKLFFQLPQLKNYI